MTLILEPHILDVDAFYERLIDMHNGLSDDESVVANERLAAALRARVGDAGTVAEAESIAARGDNDATLRAAKLILLLSNHIGDAGVLAAELSSYA